MKVSEEIKKLNEEVATYAEKFKTRIGYWLAGSAGWGCGHYNVKTMLLVDKEKDYMILDPCVFVKYRVSRQNSDYEDYDASTIIPLEYFEVPEDDFKSYKDDLDHKHKVAKAEEQRKEYTRKLRDAEYNIKYYQEEKKKYQGYLTQ
jgi:hypothetical protein